MAGLLCLVPVLAAHHWMGHSWLEDLLFLPAACLGVMFGVVTAAKYRLARTRELALAESLQVARHFQVALVPARQARWGPFLIGSHQEVSQHLGGDLFCVQPLGEDRWSMLIGDVMGKGVPAALVAAFVIGSFREPAAAGPRAILERINQLVLRALGEQSLFVTLACVELDLGVGVWRCALAGHPPPMLLRQDGSQVSLSCSGLVAGVTSEPEYEQLEVAARPGDQLFMATDGFLDEEIPESAVLEAVRRGLPAPLDEALAVLVAELKSLRPARSCTDDATAVLIRLTG